VQSFPQNIAADTLDHDLNIKNDELLVSYKNNFSLALGLFWWEYVL